MMSVKEDHDVVIVRTGDVLTSLESWLNAIPDEIIFMELTPSEHATVLGALTILRRQVGRETNLESAFQICKVKRLLARTVCGRPTVSNPASPPLSSLTVEWSMGGTAHIRAPSPEEAKSRAENMPLSDLMNASGDNCDFFEANVDDEGGDR
jgi:hypothetical protein